MSVPTRNSTVLPPRPTVSLVMPAFNSARYIADNVRRVISFFAEYELDGEVIVADDGSIDGTARAIEGAENVRVLPLPHGGKGAALRAGMAAARGEVRAFTDADLPYGLGPLPLAISYVSDRGYHAVMGDRTLPGSTYESPGILRSAVSGLASFTFRTLVTGGIYDTQCGFKAFRGDVAEELFRLSRIDGFAIDVELIYLLLKYRFDIKRVPVRMEDNEPSSVRVVRDSAAAVRDIGRMRVTWAAGRYRSRRMIEILAEDMRRDEAAAARRSGT